MTWQLTSALRLCCKTFKLSSFFYFSLLGDNINKRKKRKREEQEDVYYEIEDKGINWIALAQDTIESDDTDMVAS